MDADARVRQACLAEWMRSMVNSLVSCDELTFSRNSEVGTVSCDVNLSGVYFSRNSEVVIVMIRITESQSAW